MKRDDLRAFLAEKPYDAMVLTSEISRRYATGFHSTAGAVYLSAKQAVFFTDFRYAEAARAAISDFEVREIKAGQSYSSLINGLIEEDGAKKVALEDKTLTYAEFMSWSTALHATAVRLEDGVESLRMMKEDSEVEKIVAAQRIAEQALEEVLNDIRIGVTEKEIAAAERIVRAVQEQAAQGIGVFTIDGKMIDVAFLPGAARTIALAKACGIYKGEL